MTTIINLFISPLAPFFCPIIAGCFQICLSVLSFQSTASLQKTPIEEAIDNGNAVNDSVLDHLDFVLVSLITLSLFLLVDLIYDIWFQSSIFSWASLQSYVGREWFFRGMTCINGIKSAALTMSAVNSYSHRVRDASVLSLAFMTGNISIFSGSM